MVLLLAYPNVFTLINHRRRTCSARVTVVGSVRVCVCVSSHISPRERLFILKILSHTKQATEVEIFVGISLKPLRCRVLQQHSAHIFDGRSFQGS